MIIKLNNGVRPENKPIKTIYPGFTFLNQDTGLGSIGRIDHARYDPQQLHQYYFHSNDEIFSYFRTGIVCHTDSFGITKYLNENNLLVQKVGNSMSELQEGVADAGPVEGLKIFFRPQKKDLPTLVDFIELPRRIEGDWRLLAAPQEYSAPSSLRSQSWVYDISLNKGKQVNLPVMPRLELTGLVYIFDGKIIVDGRFNLEKTESIVISDQEVSLNAVQDSQIVLIITDEHESYYEGGNSSGNLFR